MKRICQKADHKEGPRPVGALDDLAVRQLPDINIRGLLLFRGFNT